MTKDATKARNLLEAKIQTMELIDNQIDYLNRSINTPDEDDELASWQIEENEKIQRKIEGLNLIIELLLK